MALALIVAGAPSPTQLTYKNFGADVIIAFRTNAECKGGDHVMVSHDGKTAVLVETSQLGTLISGNQPPAHLLHGN